MRTPVRSITAHRLFLVFGVFFLAGLVASGDDPKKDEKPEVTITAVTPRGNVFGDEESEFQFKIEATRAVKGLLVWRVASGTATVKAGDVALTAKANTPTVVPIKIALPPVKDGVILPTRLELSVVEPGQKKPTATFELNLWIFPKDPFADQSEWLKKRKITLFDSKGDTAKVLTAAKVPFEELKSVDALAELKEGLVIVGEGVSFKEEKGLGAALQKLAAGGLTVLILAPAAGEVLIPGVGGSVGGFDELTFRREIVRKLDKRFDSENWLPDGKVVASSLVVKMGEEAVVGEVTTGPGGWLWVEARPSTGKGRWAFCGLAIISKWEAGPTPRFLFAKLLEYLTDPETEQPKKETER